MLKLGGEGKHKGKLVKKLYRSEKIIIDGCHSEISGENFANYLKTINKTKYGIIGMSKNKNPFKFTKKFFKRHIGQDI